MKNNITTKGLTLWNRLWNLVKTRTLWFIPQGRPRAYSTGLTLIELLVTLGILVLIGVALANFQVNTFQYNAQMQERLSADHEIRQALKKITADVRVAAPSNTGAFPVVEAASSTLTFFANIDKDVLIERVHYYVTSGKLKRAVLKPSGAPLTYSGTESETTLVSYITNPGGNIFSYYNSLYSGTTSPMYQPINPLSVRLVRVQISVDKNSARPPGAISGETQASIRNLKDNL